MPRALRVSKGGIVYHVLNRANSRTTIFEKDTDYQAFGKVLSEAFERRPVCVLDYCVMPNHWHMVLWPKSDGDLSEFLGWLTMTHTQRRHASRGTTGSGHLYQGRFKSFPIQADNHLLAVCRYVARNPVRAGLVDRAEKWRWSSLWEREFGDGQTKKLLSDGPFNRPSNWCEYVNQSETSNTLAALRESVNRGRPFGNKKWLHKTVTEFGLESTLRSRGRPKKTETNRNKGS